MRLISRPKVRDTEGSELHGEVGRSGGVTAPKLSKKEKAVAKTVLELRELLKPGDTVYTKLNHVSRSGMTRSIEVMVFRDNEPINLTWRVSEILDYKIHNKHYGLKVGGCGMDMGFHVVYSLSYALYGFGYECIQDEETRCPAAYHTNSREWPRKKFEGLHKDGYALRHRWL